ncbi:iduronate 2-sulfatase isoform X2 [Frankliniella occidentalis]|uniref:Iduronate 2-sulfatase isoform X2 n=1 Tax=Frankliniella occidentalis TaxID=133901 RepID=A0A9C6X279_FRAOC|nr:iduronate 2-sulfatase isoform X2 [Frankliniella occidentalis]
MQTYNFCMAFYLSILSVMQLCQAINDKQNVLFIIADDLRTSLGCYGDKSAYSPNIDFLAQQSFVFTNAYSQQALCGPSRTSLLTSRSPHHLNQYDVHQYWRVTAGNFTSLPQFFKEKGYKTISIGKVFHPGKCSNFVDDQPFSWSAQPFHPKTEKFKNAPVCPSVSGSGPSVSIVCPVNTMDQPQQTLPDLESLREAEKYLQNHVQDTSEEPFFMAVGFHKPHIPLKFPQEYLNYHPLDKISLSQMRRRPPKLPSSAWNPWFDLRKRDDINHLNISFPWGAMPDDQALKVKQSYYASVSYIDHLIGKLLQKLDDLKLRNNTIILFTSDHGWSLGEHGEWSKYSNYEVSTQVPLILSVPGTRGRHIKNLVELLDIFPTLVDIVGIEGGVPKCINGYTDIFCTDGRSLKPLFDKTEYKIVKWRVGAFSQYPRPGDYPSLNPDSDQPHQQDIKVMGYSVRTSRHRYTEWVKFDTKTMTPNWTKVYGSELYDHVIDPNENLNLGDRENLNPLILSFKSMLYKRWST